jgi:endogenous inhibitor of DNA gyrase (YacG/DUF329 family)
MTKSTCPQCKKPVDPVFRPFCSKRCADLDLQRWLTGRYVIAAADDDEDDTPPLAVCDDDGG